ncbi:MAG: AAA family ATPase [Candidatus Micrarchaeia archaeon]
MKMIKIEKIEKEYPRRYDLTEYIPSVNYIERTFYNIVEKILQEGFTPYLIGDSGTGKTAFAEWYACKKNLPLLIVNCDFKNLRELLGHWKLTNGPTGPETEFNLGLLTHFLTTKSVVIFDEVNSLEGEYLFFLHELLNNKRFFLPEVSKVFPVEAEVILASNPTGKVYYGTQPLNFALLSRVVVVEVPCWERKELEKIIKDEEAVLFYEEVIKLSEKENLPIQFGIRELLQYEALSKVIGKQEAIKSCFLNKIKATDPDIAEAYKGIASVVFGEAL